MRRIERETTLPPPARSSDPKEAGRHPRPEGLAVPQVGGGGRPAAAVDLHLDGLSPAERHAFALGFEAARWHETARGSTVVRAEFEVHEDNAARVVAMGEELGWSMDTVTKEGRIVVVARRRLPGDRETP